MLVRSLFGLCLSAAILVPSPGGASIYLPPGWRSQVGAASFVGIVECEIAGLGVARYRVIESWKGPPAGTLLTAEDRSPPGARPALRVHLCGERYLLCASVPPPSLWNPDVNWWSRAGIHEPLLWRDAGAGYQVTSAVRVRPKSKHYELQFGDLGFYPPKVSAYRDSVRSLARRPGSVAEVGGLRPDDSRRRPILAAFVARHPILDLHRALADSMSTLEGLALGLLTPAEPDLVRDHLLRRSSTESGMSGATAYSLASYFAWQCDSDRPLHFRKLLDARDPVVRAAGAVYLSFEDSLAGVGALRAMTSLPGFAGIWASMSLARRGDREAADGLMARLDSPDPVPEAYRNHIRHQRLQLLSLLSNSARISGFTLPPLEDPEFFGPYDKAYPKAVRDLRKWWAKARDRVVLSDPWLPVFASRGVD